MNSSVTFFLDEKSNQKNQDLDLFAKKITTCLKILNLRESTIGYLMSFCGRASNRRIFLRHSFIFS